MKQTSGDDGFTLVELLVGMLMMGVVGLVLSTTVLGARSSAETTRLSDNLNEEARVALNRLSRELRESSRIVGVYKDGQPVQKTSPDSANSLTFEVDFNGDRVIQANSSTDPEVLTYCYDQPNKRLLIVANSPDPSTCTTLTGKPLLAAHVTDFKLRFRSSYYQYGATWPDLDGSSVGDGDDQLSTAELRYVDSVVVDLKVLDGVQQQDYRTQVDLRNQR